MFAGNPIKQSRKKPANKEIDLFPPIRAGSPTSYFLIERRSIEITANPKP
jgi:hypothetical protein